MKSSGRSDRAAWGGLSRAGLPAGPGRGDQDLPEVFNDRFEREARAIASLNHPELCTLHDVGPNYLAMELVGGETLAERICRGPIPFEESLRIARQIAEALDAAHSRGIVHRDLKPANVKLTTGRRGEGSRLRPRQVACSGDVIGVGAAAVDSRTCPTASPSATMAGTVLGTAADMAPEQARGEPVDKRADIWAFAPRPARDVDRPRGSFAATRRQTRWRRSSRASLIFHVGARVWSGPFCASA